PYIMGFPFPIIDPADPKAGTKILWNYFYRTWYTGSLRAETQLNWVAPKSLDRRADVGASFEQYDGVPPDERLPNADNFSVRVLAMTISPADLNGTAALTWRYRDSDKRDSTWAYVPALRRVRAVSPANRSDGFLGSDMSQDDGQFFDGKPEDFTWALRGESDQLRFVDPLSLKGDAQQVWLPTGGWRNNWPDLKFLGYMDPTWKGIAWAPIVGVLARRPFWVVEGIPKDKYYLYGRIQIYIDKETFQGAWNRKFSWDGELLNTLQVMAFLAGKFTRPDGKVDYNMAQSMAFQCAENVKRNQATVAGIKSNPKADFDYRVKFPATFFDMNALGRAGK
ncbi:MAG: outer membrane lipoprotein-sorting protein, partial [Gaiellaceae bacterium]